MYSTRLNFVSITKKDYIAKLPGILHCNAVAPVMFEGFHMSDRCQHECVVPRVNVGGKIHKDPLEESCCRVPAIF